MFSLETISHDWVFWPDKNDIHVKLLLIPYEITQLRFPQYYLCMALNLNQLEVDFVLVQSSPFASRLGKSYSWIIFIGYSFLLVSFLIQIYCIS